MCYPNGHRVVANDPVKQNRILVATVQEDTPQQVAAGASVRIRLEGGGGASGGVTKQCVCSPTRHPGSFRCRYHHTEYKWVGRVGPRPC